MGRIVRIVILLVLGAVGWHYRDKWLPIVKRKLGTIEVRNPIASEPPLRYTISAVDRA